MQASQAVQPSAFDRWIQRYGATRLLRNALKVNAVSSATTGLIGLLFAGTVGELIGVDQLWLIRLVGGGLFAFAISVYLLSRAEVGPLTSGAGVISLNDFGWVGATAVVIGLGWLSVQGAVIMGLIAVMVFGFGAAQLVAKRAI